MSERPRNHRGSNSSRFRSQSHRSSTEGRVSALSDFADSSKFKIIFIVFVALALVFFARLLYLQVIVSDEYSSQAQASRTISFDISARRGTIYDRNGVVLATSVDATTVYCDPSEITDVSYAATKIAETLGGKASDYTDVLDSDTATFAYVKRQADVEAAAKLEQLDIAGIYFIEDSRREYPNGAIGGQVIGVCDVDGNGLTGLELQYDEILKGTPGTYSAQRGRDGTPIPGGVTEDVPAVDGQDIMISIDIKLQDSVEQALKAGVEDPRIAGEKGTSVVMDAATGEIYAICSLPYLDPTNREKAESDAFNLSPVSQAFEPGSIFKTVTLAAALEELPGLEERTWVCEGSAQIGDGTVTCTAAHGEQDIREALANSCNVVFGQLAVELGGSTLERYAGKAGLTSRYSVNGIPTAAGSFSLTGISDNDLAWAGVGQYHDAVNPCSMLVYMGAIANGGRAAVPCLLLQVDTPGLPDLPQFTRRTGRLIARDTAETLADMMAYNVTAAYGTSRFPNMDLCAKSGTAEVGGGQAPHAWFTGFLRDEDHPYAFLVLVENGGSGSSAAGDVASRVLNALVSP